MKPLAEEEEEEGGHAVSTDKGKKRKQEPQPTPEMERLSDQLHGENQALKRCKQEFIEEDHAALHHTISAVEAAVQCGICLGTMMQASTVSGCGHTFCRSCIEEALRVKGCCPQCLLPAWHCDIRDSRRVSAIMDALVGERDHVGAGEQYRASLVKSAAGPTPHVVYDLFNQIVSIKDPDHATGYRPKFYFVLEYKVMMLCVVPLFFCFGFACPLGAFLVDY